MDNNSPAMLIVLKPSGRYGCRDCDYETKMIMWTNAKKNVARHWREVHAPDYYQEEQDKQTEDSASR